MESVAFIQWCLDHLNYWTITLLMAIESSFIPFPSEVVVPPAAYKAAVNEELNIYLVVLFATIGANIGALINYYLARWLGRPIVYKFANSRFGHMCLIDEAKVQHAEEYFDKHGALSTFIGRLIPAVRQLISIPAGLARMKLHTFLIYTTLGAGLWNLPPSDTICPPSPALKAKSNCLPKLPNTATNWAIASLPSESSSSASLSTKE